MTSVVATLGTEKFSRVYGGETVTSSGKTVIYVVASGDRQFLAAINTAAKRSSISAQNVTQYMGRRNNHWQQRERLDLLVHADTGDHHRC